MFQRCVSSSPAFFQKPFRNPSLDSVVAFKLIYAQNCAEILAAATSCMEIFEH